TEYPASAAPICARKSLKISTAAAIPEMVLYLRARMSGLQGDRTHDRENLCRLRLRTGCQRHQGEGRRKHGGGVLRGMRAVAEGGQCLDVRQDAWPGGLSDAPVARSGTSLSEIQRR